MYTIQVGEERPQSLNKRKTPIELDKVYVNDFGDNYNLSDDEKVIVDPDIMKLKSNYKSHITYLEAKIKRNEYMVRLLEKYGRVFPLYMKMGLVKEYIPPKPSIKSKKLKRYFKYGMIISEPLNPKRDKIDQDEIDKVISNINIPEDFTLNRHMVNMKKSVSKRLKEYAPRTKLSRAESNQFTLTAIENFMVNSTSKFLKDKNDESRKPTVSEIMNCDEYYIKYMKDQENGELYEVNGSKFTDAEHREYVLSKELTSRGYNGTYIVRKMKGFSSKKLKKLSKVEKLNRKKDKVIEKKLAKSKGKLATHLGFDNMLDDGDFDDFKKDYLDFTSNNITGGD